VQCITAIGCFTVKQSSKDEIKGKAHEVKGAVKEKVGQAEKVIGA
jgi:hypothetical protein